MEKGERGPPQPRLLLPVENHGGALKDGPDEVVLEAIDRTVRLMYLANEGDLEGIKELLDSGIDVNFTDIDGKTALHVAACQGQTEIVEFLLWRGAEVDRKDQWGSTEYQEKKQLPEPEEPSALETEQSIVKVEEEPPEETSEPPLLNTEAKPTPLGDTGEFLGLNERN